MSEETVLAELSADNVRSHVEHIIYKIPSRLAGSENGRRMAEYSAAALKEVDVDAEVRETPGLVSFPEHAEMRVLAPQELAVQANTLGHSVPTLSEGITGELVYVGSGSFEECDAKGINGKITLSELSYSPARHEKQRIAALGGAIGAVMMNWGHPENEAVPFGSVKPVWGNPTPETYDTEMPRIPCIGIARTAGLKLKEIAESTGGVRVWFRTHIENAWRPVQITVGKVKAPDTEDFVLVGGHQDSWYGEASTDNAAGNSCMIELARVFQRHRDKLRRGVEFGFWVGHETGTMIGSSWYADQEWDRLRDHACAYMQIDQPGMTGTSVWRTHSNAEMRRFHQDIEKRLLGNRAMFWHPAAKNGDSSFFGIGIPSMHGEAGFTDQELDDTANAALGWWHHSVECTFDKLDWGWMADSLKVYGAWLWELCTAPVLPFEFVSVAEQFETRIAALADAGSNIGLKSTLERARSLGETAARFDKLSQTWRQRYVDGTSDGDEPADILNECMKRVSRRLVPIQSTQKGTYGHDPYGYTPQTSMIPALYDVPRLAGLADGEERWMLETHLVRERNRVTDAVADAEALMKEAMRRLT